MGEGHAYILYCGFKSCMPHKISLLQGDTLASCDSYGTVKLWDVRTGSPMTSFDVGPHPANRVAFDPTGTFIILFYS